MVSLKSFKLINEGERDESPSSETSDPKQTNSISTAFVPTRAAEHHQHHHHLNNNIGPVTRPLTSSSRHPATVFQNDVRENNNNQDEPTSMNPTIVHHHQATKTSRECEGKSSVAAALNNTKMPGDNRAIVKVSLPSHLIQPTTTPTKTTTTTTTTTPKQQVAKQDNDHEKGVSPSSSSISIIVVQHDNPAQNGRQVQVPSDDDEYMQDAGSSSQSFSELDNSSEERSSSSSCAPQRSALAVGIPITGLANGSLFSAPDASSVHPNVGANMLNNNEMHLYSPTSAKDSDPGLTGCIDDSRLSVGGDHFEIVWSNLSYKIEPKWYKKINFIDQVFSHFMPGQTMDTHSSATSTASSSANMNDNQHQMHSSTNADSHLHNTLNPKQKSSLDPIEIFANLNGTIKSGQMTAVLGPSGAGKTTLLNCLTGKLRKGVSGHINLIGANGKHLKMCTIPQKDHLLELLTVEENLWFASKIKNPEYGFDHVKNIERVIDLLGLKRCRSAKIKKISGGQHKRVSIAQELLSNPDILVLDEPTSGLDSLTCFKTISMLRDLVELSANNDFMKPMAIIVTIHQPQPKVFNLFHHVYILANGGRVIYEGAPELSLDTITSVTGLRPIDSGSSAKSTSMTPGSIDPASFLIEIASEEYGAEPIKVLNDHHRRAFYETNHPNYNQHQSAGTYQLHNNLAGGQFHFAATNLNAKDNHGFSPDFEGDAEQTSKSRGLSTIFVPNQQVHAKNTKELEKHNNNIKGVISSSEMADSEGSRRKESKKVKKRKKSTYSLESGVSSGFSSRSADTSHSVGANSDSRSLYMSEQLLYTREANHKGRFWSHTATLTHRTLLTIRRDPLLMTSRVLFHLMIPILMGHVYGKATGAANACPHYEPEIDITQIPSLVEGKRIEYMLEELHMSIENVSMFFIIMYAFAAAVLALNALSFPLNMQVLLKETRNGWYSMSSYILAKTLADLPLELTMPCLTMALVYPLTGQPSSYLQWRMLTICLIMTLCSLIAQTQALILGALVMNSVQTAVFVSQASQLPWVILAGFTIRIKRLSEPLKLISLTSFYRLGCEAITLTRYGFGICPCDPQEITGEPVRLVGIPDQLRTLAQYWIDSMEANKASNNDSAVIRDTSESATDQAGLLLTTTLAPSSPSAVGGSKTDIFQHLANQLSYANSYGVNITSCDDVAPDRIRAINLGDNWLVARIWHLFIMLIIMKVLLYYAVKFSIGIRL